MKTLKVTKIEGGYYLHEIVDNGKMIARYVLYKECECMSVDGNFKFFANKSNADSLKTYEEYRCSAEKAANLDERGYNLKAAEYFASEVVGAIRFAAKGWRPELFHEQLTNEINTFFEVYPTRGEKRKRKIEEIREAGRKALEGSELVYRDEPGVTGEQENR